MKTRIEEVEKLVEEKFPRLVMGRMTEGIFMLLSFGKDETIYKAICMEGENIGIISNSFMKSNAVPFDGELTLSND